MSLGEQVAFLFILPIPIACIAWTITHEEVFREPRDFCKRKSEQTADLLKRKIFYVFTCEYCFSHYVTLFFLAITGYHLLYRDWRGYLIAFFALVWVANVYMNLYAHFRLEIKKDRVEIEAQQKNVDEPDLVHRP